MPLDFPPLQASARPESIARLRRAAADAAARAGAAGGTVDEVRLAVSEAATNAVLHAYPEGRPGRLRLDVGLEEGDLVVTVEDDGWGMRPRNDSPGLGLGLPIISRLARQTDVESGPDGGTTLRMRFALAGRPD